MARPGERRQGYGKTLDEAFDDYARQKSADLLAEHGEMSLNEALEAFEKAWFPVSIEVQLRPHNQWIRGFSVRDAS